MSTTIGPIQLREEKPAYFNFVDEKPTGTLSEPVVTISVVSGEDPNPSAVLVGSPSIDGLMVAHTVKYQVPGVLYMLQASAKDSNGKVHTVTAYLLAKASV